ncbi:MAG: ABC transporter permease [Anaerolineaceae bacterium]|jgi:ABC-2 type transport system permease protein|nr:ABC transporter permease [Anaerolineaceae bacterium]
MIYRFFNNIASFIMRISAFISKEFFNVISQPRLMAILILGPFLILFLFGISYQNTFRTLRTAIVVPEGKEIQDYVNTIINQPIPNIEVVSVTTEKTKAMFGLQSRQLDLVMVVPPDIAKNLEDNQQSVFTFYHQEIDPFDISYVEIIISRLRDKANRDVLFRSVEQTKELAETYRTEVHTLARVESQLSEGENRDNAANAQVNSPNRNAAILWFLLQSLAGEGDNASPSTADTEGNSTETRLEIIDKQLTSFVGMDSAILVAPFRNEVHSLSDVEIKPVHFYVPSVLALLLQHIALSLAALSIVSERFSGTMEIMRASPANAFEILVGKYLSFSIFLGVLIAILIGLVHFLLGVPMLGNWIYLGVAAFLVVLVSSGFGFLISSFVRSDSQAVQFSMVFLLASIFFSGFFLQLYQLRWPAQIVSWILPATYGIKTLQDIMLRGIQPQMNLLLILAGMAAALFIINWARLHRLLVQR